jgi:hypothetical protein
LLVRDCEYIVYDVNFLVVNQWEVEFFSDDNENCELQEWILNLKQSHRDKVIAWIDKLQEMGPLLPRPYADILRDGIHELRIKVAHNQMRISIFSFSRTKL